MRPGRDRGRHPTPAARRRREFALGQGATEAARRFSYTGTRSGEELLDKVPDDLPAFLDTHFKAVVITTDDDAQLNQRGVRSRMPQGWELGSDPWVRYEHAGFRRGDFLVPCEVRPELA